MKTLFIVDYWLPYSEYGGVDIVIADGEEEAIELLVQSVSKFEKEDNPKYQELITKEVQKSLKFEVEATESEIIYSFNT